MPRSELSRPRERVLLDLESFDFNHVGGGNRRVAVKAVEQSWEALRFEEASVKAPSPLGPLAAVAVTWAEGCWRLACQLASGGCEAGDL